MSVDYQNSILWRGEDPLKKKFAPQYDGTRKTTRYFPGQVPAWAREKKDDDNEDMSKAKKKRKLAPVEDAAANRLKRLQASESAGDTGAERLLRHRVIHDARVLEAADEEPPQVKKKKEEEEAKVKLQDVQAEIAAIRKNLPGYKEEDDIVKKEEEEDDDDVAKSGPLAEVKTEEDDAEDERLRLRERARELALLKRKREEEELKAELKDELPLEDEDESEYETDSEDEDPRQKAMLKPVFVSRAQRDTVKEKELLEKEEEEAEERRRLKLKERKAESKTMLIDEITRDDQAEREAQFNPDDASDIELIDDDDEKNEAEEYELWKIRELKRIKRDKAERVARQKELEWIEKRRNMTDEERMRDDERLDAKNPKKADTKQFNFLQKYYHKGTFFQDKATSGEEPLYNRDYHEPLEEEKFDKTLLPAAMQVRRGLFGKKGQVKHTHLTDVDTTDMSAAWSQHSKQVQRYQERMAGASGVDKFDRPSSSKSII
mmetsp:Transcript_64319/g.112167  ORF Transcript_64319/g.112167 Transcript_64319/m.112167 type:complete len:490 (-) Transcript_64319:147-1616(-)